MPTIQNILVATDYSEQARPAETRAAMLSVALKASRLEILAVQTTGMSLNARTPAAQHIDGDTDLAEVLLVEHGAPVSLTSHSIELQCMRSLAAGEPSAAIAKRADELDADLTIVPGSGRRFLPDFFARNVNDELIRLCSRPMLLVHAEPDRPYAKVLVAVDFSEESKEAARVALAAAPSAHFTFLHACHIPEENSMGNKNTTTAAVNAGRMAMCEKARGELNLFISQLGPRKQLITRAIHYGQTVSVICEYAKRMHADLIAIGKHGKSRCGELMPGSTALRLLKRSPCDMLIASTSAPDGWDDRPAA